MELKQNPVDNKQFIAGVDMDIYVGHDDRVSRPDFLKQDCVDTGGDIDFSHWQEKMIVNSSIIKKV